MVAIGNVAGLSISSRVGMVGTMEGGDYRHHGMVAIGNSIPGLSISSWGGISGPLAIHIPVSIAMVEAIVVSIHNRVGIVSVVRISRSISISSYQGQEASNDSHGFDHYDVCKLED